MTSSFTSGGNSAAMDANFAFTPSITATVLASDCRRMSSVTVGIPFKRASVRGSLVPSSARPMSRTRMGVRLIVATTRSLNFAGSAIFPNVRSVFSRRSDVTLPPGDSAFWFTIASRTAVIGI